AERFKAPVLKTGEGVSSPWVRIPPLLPRTHHETRHLCTFQAPRFPTNPWIMPLSCPEARPGAGNAKPCPPRLAQPSATRSERNACASIAGLLPPERTAGTVERFLRRIGAGGTIHACSIK